MDELDSWELTDFNIEGQITLSQKFGHLKMMRSGDGKVILVDIASYGIIDQTKPTPTSFFHPDSTLGFVLDIGIRREKMLTRGSGFYFGEEMMPVQSKKKVKQSDFDQALFEKIGDIIDTYFQSGDEAKEITAIKLQFLIDDYNNARLLYPNFYGESYLSLMRIIDSLANARGAYDYAVFTAQISPQLNQNIYDKIVALPVYAEWLAKADSLFQRCLKHASDNGWTCHSVMSTFDTPAKLVFSCFYSAYQYRNKFVHKGFPFPSIVRDGVDVENDSGLAYISPAWGQSWSRFHRPQTGIEAGDIIDVHTIVGAEAQDFKELYFLLIPTWYFLKKIAKEASDK